MYKLWEVKVEGGNGKELYGEHYADIWAINRLHFKGATGTDICDNVRYLRTREGNENCPLYLYFT